MAQSSTRSAKCWFNPQSAIAEFLMSHFSSTARRAGAPTVSWTIAFAAAALVLALRAPDALRVPQLWAEDGTIFFGGQHGHLLPQLFVAYAGYLHWIIRLVAWTATWFSAACTPAIYNYAALAIAAASIASLRALPLALGGYALLLAPFALTPTSGEVFGTLTNSQWFTQFYLIVVVTRFVRGETPAHAWRSGIATVLVSLSGPYCLMAAPGALIGLLWRYHVERDHHMSLRASLLAPAARNFWLMFGCSLIQLGYIVFDDTSGHASLAQTLGGVTDMLICTQAHVLGFAAMPNPVFLTLLATIVVAALMLVRRAGGDRSVLLALLIFTLLELLAPANKIGAYPGLLANLVAADRYFLLPKIVVWWCVAIVANGLWRSANAPYVVVAALLGSNAVSASGFLQRSVLPDLDWPAYAPQIDAGQEVSIPINPIGWRVALPARTPP